MVEEFRGEAGEAAEAVIVLLLRGSDAELLAGNVLVYAMGSGFNDC
jgi:hypothetical protein